MENSPAHSLHERLGPQSKADVTDHTHLLVDGLQLGHRKLIPSQPHHSTQPLWTILERFGSRTTDIPPGDHLMLALRVVLERMVQEDCTAYLEEEGRCGQEVIHELDGTEEGVTHGEVGDW